MNNFMNYIQPTIVKLSDSEDIPSSLQNRYMINLNIVGIQYFQENFIMTEGPGGNLMLQEKYEEGDSVKGLTWLLEDSITEENVLDIPRAYIVISSDLMEDDSALKNYIIAGLVDNAVFGNGTEDLLPGKDFYINNTLYEYLLNENLIEENEDIVLPNYLTQGAEISEYFEELTCQEKDYSNITYYYNKNLLQDNIFSEDALNDFYATFASTILQFTAIDDETRATTKNQIYDTVLHYYANYKSDSTSVALNLILNTPYGNLTNSSCGCQTSSCNSGTSTSSSYSTVSCYDMYINAMPTYLKTMLGDPDFYNDWFTISMPDGTSIVNDTLIDALETLIHEFMSLGYDITNLNKKKRGTIMCGCKSLTQETQDYTTLLNYLKILDWLRNCLINTNLNKTKIYGEAFGEILPLMQF